MDTRIIKAIVTLGIAAFAIWLFFQDEIAWGVIVSLIAIISGLLVFRSIRLIRAMFALRSQKMDKARGFLNQINPEHLWPKQKGYYYLLLGTANAEHSSFAQSEKHFRQALSHGLKYDHDKAMVYMNLAVLTANKRKKREALNLLNEAKKYDGKGMMKEQLKQVSQMINRI
ncbi:MAG: DUF2892 domain-containing protein [Flavobacteriales bacterium]|nr:DUF2892 domain-containing protein [Flavobacteriales bacterium]